MAKVTIDGRSVEVAAGATLLDAASALGIAIPTLCHLPGHESQTSCFVCVVQVEGRRELSPACATMAVDGMVVRTDTDDVRAARQRALELLLSDHTGDCVAPCTLACPAHLDVADFIAELTAGDVGAAIRTIKRTIALPASLGRVCPRFCEKACRRKDVDGEAVAICALRRFVADADLASAEPYTPAVAPSTGRRVAVVGAGPGGLSAAFYLQQMGHGCVVFDRGTKAGGLFREGIDVARLPRDVLDGEIACLERMGVEWRMGVELGRDASLDDLRREHDAVVLAMGAQVAAGAERRFAEKGYVGVKVEADLSLVAGMGLETRPRGVKADRQTTATNLEKVFAAGNVASGPNYAVHAVASGRRAALAVGQLLRGRAVVGEHEPVRVLMGGLGEAEQGEWRSFAHEGRRASIDGEEGPGARAALSAEAAAAEARRCLDCDCGNRRDCRLRLFADEYDATAKRFAGERRGFHRDDSHAEVVYESGKCIQCGICVRLAEEAGEELGLSPIGRGFTVTTGTPFEERLAAGLKRIGRRCAEACPTGALSLKRSLRLRAE